MPRRNTLVFMAVLLLFILALLVVFPIERGLGGRGIRLGLDLQGGVHMVYRADLSAIAPAEQANALAAAQAVLENRVNPLGVTEPIVQRQGTDRIIVELPGRSITDKEKESLARVDILEFGEKTTDNATAKWENELGKWKPATDIINGEEKVLTSRYFKTNTQVSRDNLGGIELNFQWDKEGGQLSEKITGRLIGKQLAIFDGADALRGEDGRPIAPTVQAVITEGGRITGLTLNDATRLSKQLNYGRLPVPLEAIYDQTVSPILGADFVRMSVRAGIAAVAIIMLFMILYYHLSGVIASLGLIYYGILLMAIFKLLGVTLTLTAIGGFILSLGMAVDANVLIFERMKEEMWTGKSLGAAIDAGFNRAWPVIWDSNITTILAGLILLWLGSSIVASGPVKGFALTLVIGVASSMFTTITVTRTLLRPFIGTGLAQKTFLFSPHQRKEKANV